MINLKNEFLIRSLKIFALSRKQAQELTMRLKCIQAAVLLQISESGIHRHQTPPMWGRTNEAPLYLLSTRRNRWEWKATPDTF